MKFTNKQQHLTCIVLDNLTTHYYDQMGENNDVSRLSEYDQIDFAICQNIYARIKNSAEGSSQRFTQPQKEYLIRSIRDCIEFNEGGNGYYDRMDLIILQSIIDGL